MTTCDLFLEVQDYATYLERNGCNFGSFTCCDGVNRTILDEFAKNNNCETDHCDVSIMLPICITLIIFLFAFIIVEVVAYRLRSEYLPL
jgi:hypothetical protein